MPESDNPVSPEALETPREGIIGNFLRLEKEIFGIHHEDGDPLLPQVRRGYGLAFEIDGRRHLSNINSVASYMYTHAVLLSRGNEFVLDEPDIKYRLNDIGRNISPVVLLAATNPITPRLYNPEEFSTRHILETHRRKDIVITAEDIHANLKEIFDLHEEEDISPVELVNEIYDRAMPIYIGVLLSGSKNFAADTKTLIERKLIGLEASNPRFTKLCTVLSPAVVDADLGNVGPLKEFFKKHDDIRDELTKFFLIFSTLTMLSTSVEASASTLSQRRSAYRMLAGTLLNSEIPENIDRIRAGQISDSPQETIDGKTEVIDLREKTRPMEMDFEPLPPGKLREGAEEIVKRALARKKRNGDPSEVEIDLSRLDTLTEIYDAWGPDSAYYSIGKLKKRGRVRKDGVECPDEYLMVVVQDRDPETREVIQEHVVAESPIKGPHAMYVYRQDVGEGFSWQIVMEMDKTDARLFNARKVMHRENGLSMSEKAMILLNCEKDEFLRIKFEGNRGFRLLKSHVEVSV